MKVCKNLYYKIVGIFSLSSVFSVFLVSSLFSLCIVMMSNQVYAQDEEGNAEIVEDVSRVHTSKGSELAKKLEIQLRSAIEGLMIEGINRSLYMQKPKDASDEDAIKALVLDHFTRYCSKDAKNEGGSNAECSGDLLVQHADIKYSNISSTSRLDENRLSAAKRFANTLVDPRPSTKFKEFKTADGKPITKEEIEKDSKLRDDLAELLINQTLLSIARDVFANQIAERTELKDSDQTMMELFDTQSCQRFYNTEWQANMKAAYFKALNTCDPKQSGCDPSKPLDPTKEADPVKAAQVEGVVMDATRTCLNFKAYQQGERIEALLASIIALNYRQAQETKAFIKATQPEITTRGTPGGGATGGNLPPPRKTEGGTDTGTGEFNLSPEQLQQLQQQQQPQQ